MDKYILNLWNNYLIILFNIQKLFFKNIILIKQNTLNFFIILILF